MTPPTALLAAVAAVVNLYCAAGVVFAGSETTRIGYLVVLLAGLVCIYGVSVL